MLHSAKSLSIHEAGALASGDATHEAQEEKNVKPEDLGTCHGGAEKRLRPDPADG